MNEDTSLYRRYLLGQLEEHEQEELETSLMTDEGRFQELLIAEDELVDEYVAGELSANDEARYRSHFLAAGARQEQHRFGEALRRYVDRETERKVDPSARRGWLAALAAAAALLVSLGVWQYFLRPAEPFRLEAVAGEGSPSARAVFLPANQFRGETSSEPTVAIAVPAAPVAIELQLDLRDEGAGDFLVTLERDGDSAALAEGVLPAQTIDNQWVVVASVPSEILEPGDYRVTLTAKEQTPSPARREFYRFRVSR